MARNRVLSTYSSHRGEACRWSSPRRTAAPIIRPIFLAASRLDPLALRRSEDSFVDELFGAAPASAPRFFRPGFPRAYVDVNREAYELDPACSATHLPGFVNAGSPRVRMGLGTIARIVASGEEIYAGSSASRRRNDRIERLYYPYHHALRRWSRIPKACLADICSSIATRCLRWSVPPAADGADIVLGDCHGAACAPGIVEAARSFLRTRLCGRDQRPLCRRVHHRPLRPPARSAATRCRSRSIGRSIWTSAAIAVRRGFRTWSEISPMLVESLGCAMEHCLQAPPA